MLEYLALPGWKTPPTTARRLGRRSSPRPGGPVIVSRESSTVAWLEVAPLRLRGYVVIENGHAAAINFELHDPDPGPPPGPSRRPPPPSAGRSTPTTRTTTDDDDDDD